MREFLADVNGLNLADKDFGFFRNLNPGKSRDRYRLLTNDFCIKSAVDDYCFTNLFDFVIFKEVASSGFKLFANCIVNVFVYNARLF